jgi:AraC-like DNA-binding protein
MNCVLPETERRVYEADEALILLYASLNSDLSFHIPGQAPIALNRPELTMVSIPKGMPVTIDVQGGVRQQRLYGMFRNAAIAKLLGIREDTLPQALQKTAQGSTDFGRLVSVPLDHHVASLVADTIDTPLQGEMRALQYHGRLIELVAYAIDAIGRSAESVAGTMRSEREIDLAQQARERLSHEYKQPPDLDDLARELGTNPNKLRSAFKTAFGVTMAEYCLDRRMREAQQLLLQAKLNISQVGERVGYEYPSGFAAAFTRHVGMSPREYRKHRAAISVPLHGDDDHD